MKSKVILVGCGGSGKDYLAQYLTTNKNFKRNVAYTTRPKRDNETDGKDYFFISPDSFESKIEEGYWHEYNIFIPEKKWYYGSSRNQFQEKNLFIKEPHGISLLSKEERDQCLVVYIDIDENTRRERMSIRKGNDDSIERRIEGDRRDFDGFTDYDIRVTDPNFDCESVYNIISDNIVELV